MPKPPVKRGAGRPKVEIDWEYVGKLLEAGATAEGVAATIGCHRNVLYDRCQKDNKIDFSAFSQQKRAKGDEQLRVKQFRTAMGDKPGSVTMQIWLGKQRLGQSDDLYKDKPTVNINFNRVVLPPPPEGAEIEEMIHSPLLIQTHENPIA